MREATFCFSTGETPPERKEIIVFSGTNVFEHRYAREDFQRPVGEGKRDEGSETEREREREKKEQGMSGKRTEKIRPAICEMIFGVLAATLVAPVNKLA